MSEPIPLFRAGVLGNEEAYVAEVIASGRLGGGGGGFAGRCEALLEERLGAARVLLTPSCTATLEMSALLLDLQPGDEVIMPSFTFVSTANAFCLRGAVPRFVDIREDSLNLDERLVEAAVNERTRAIVPVHYGGVGCDMDALGAIAARHGPAIVEDAARAIGAGYRDRPLGAIGDFGTISFHESKNLGCGEGGALVIHDAERVDAAEVVRDKGTDRRAFMDGRVDKYTWRAVGSSYQTSELNAAFLLGQLERQEQTNDHRRRLHARYRNALRPLAERGLIRHQAVPQDCQDNAHILSVICADADTRDALIAFLRARDIGATFHFVPLHTAPMGRGFGYREGTLPITESVSARLLRLPLFAGLREDQVDRVAAAVTDFFDRPGGA